MSSHRQPLSDPVRAFASGLPEAWEDHPWGESVFNVGKKVFVFFGFLETDDGFRFTVKLRDSHEEAMPSNGSCPPAAASTVADGLAPSCPATRRSR